MKDPAISPQKVEVHKFGRDYSQASHIVSDPLREPGSDEIRIRNQFAGVNGLFDHMAMQGKIGYMSLSLPFDLGVEAIGRVEAAGPDSGFSVGDAVATTGLGGAYRHIQVVKGEKAYAIPSIDPQYLAIVPTGISALVALEQVAELKPGETVVITAAAGGLGHIWVQLAVNLGCRVIGIAGRNEKCDFVRSLGAENCINYRKEDVAERLKTLCPDAINVAVDTVGGTIFDALVENLAPLGRLVVSGYASEVVEGAKPVLHPRVYEKLYWKGASVRGFMNALLAEHHRDAAKRLYTMMEQGELKVSIDPTLFKGLSALPDAANHMMSGHNIGKTILDLREPV
ncbi:zinc-binding dehydrogenase [Litorimonas haliclonae]|uniref:zinc-binding dehydrogenase n=1 Tax=Litorimonas haliclonae TaxID=2081977 RepID=UPI0039EF6678